MSDVSRFFFFMSGLMTAVFRGCGNTPVRRDILTIARTSEAMQLKTVLKKPVGRMSRQQEEEFRYNVFQVFLVYQKKLCHGI